MVVKVPRQLNIEHFPGQSYAPASGCPLALADRQPHVWAAQSVLMQSSGQRKTVMFLYPAALLRKTVGLYDCATIVYGDGYAA